MRHLALALLLVAAAAAVAHASGRPTSTPGSGRGGNSGPGSTSSGSGHHGRIVAFLPDGSLRDMCTAFTQVTEGPFALAEGHTELTLLEVSGSSARLDSIRSADVSVSGMGVARGLANRWSVGATLDAWSGLSLITGPVTGQTSPGGFGGGAVSARHTFFGVDSSGVALGVLFTVTLPAAANSPLATSYGAAVALPFAASLPADVSLGAMAQVATLPDVADTGRHLRFVDSLKLDRQVLPHLEGWAEVVSIADREPGAPWLLTGNAGLSVEGIRHVGLSAGVAMGTARGAMDHGFFGGLALKL